MNAAALCNAASFGFAVVLMSYVLFRRAKSPLHWTMLGLLAGIAIWAGGATWRHMATTRPELLLAFGVMFLGVCVVPPLWLLLAARLSRLQLLEDRPEHVAPLLAPGLLFYATFLTNERHGAFAAIDVASFEYGPLFWMLVGWAYLCVLGGVVLFLRRARWMAIHHELPRALLLALAALVPLVTSVSYLGQLLPWTFDPTAASLGISTGILFPLLFRLSLLDDLPLVRRDVIDHLADGVVIADPEGTILDANPGAAELIGAPLATLRGAPLDAVLSRLVAAEDRPVLEAALAVGRGVGHPCEVTSASGQRVRLLVVSVAGRGGQPAGRFVVLHDATDERRKEHMLRRAQKLESLGLLAAGIAHEVNNPLAFVRPNLGQLARAAELACKLSELAPPERAVELAEMPELVAESIDGVERIARIVASMRRLAREGREEEGGSVDANAVLRESLKLAQLGRSFRVATSLDPALPLVYGSKDGLTQVFLNLVVNAKQALGEQPGGRIRVATRHQDGAVEVAIEDNGPGIAHELLDRVFDPFFTTKGPEEGSGLGLPIAFDIVRAHRGTLSLESRPGHGTRFTIRLPAASSQA
jgi:PAS domain S-box-containing protein